MDITITPAALSGADHAAALQSPRRTGLSSPPRWPRGGAASSNVDRLPGRRGHPALRACAAGAAADGWQSARPAGRRLLDPLPDLDCGESGSTLRFLDPQWRWPVAGGGRVQRPWPPDGAPQEPL